MKKLLLSCCALAFLAPAAAFACPPEGRGMPMMEKVDTDKDGSISMAEADAAAKTHFEAMDENKDGSLSLAEFDKAPRPHGMDGKEGAGQGKKGPDSDRGQMRGDMRGEGLGMMREKRFESMDADKDGKVSQAEFLAGAKKRHEWMDTNKDGTISKEEMQARREKMKEKRQDRKGQGGPMGDWDDAPQSAPETKAPALNE
ncbi:MAG: EF-hand domain-containing protein [Rhodospirillales bacterium]|nr:EF-hand domain-containing protein [Rhodospirillales bacterium]